MKSQFWTSTIKDNIFQKFIIFKTQNCWKQFTTLKMKIENHTCLYQCVNNKTILTTLIKSLADVELLAFHFLKEFENNSTSSLSNENIT